MVLATCKTKLKVNGEEKEDQISQKTETSPSSAREKAGGRNFSTPDDIDEADLDAELELLEDELFEEGRIEAAEFEAVRAGVQADKAKALADKAAAKALADKELAATDEAAAKALADKEPTATAAATSAPVAAKKAVPSAEDDNDSTLEAYVESVLKENTSFTTDENISLDYQELADTIQSTDSGGGFTREDLTKFIRSTENKCESIFGLLDFLFD